MAAALHINMEKMAHAVNVSLPLMLVASFLGGTFLHFGIHFLTVGLVFFNLLNGYYLFGQKSHALLSNFGVMAQLRYVMESIGPEMRQYFFMGDTEERPFTRIQRAEVYRKAKNVDSSLAFGSQLDFDEHEYKLRHSMFPVPVDQVEPYRLTLGEERGIANAYTLTKPLMISAMSYGALGQPAVRSLARGARLAGVAMNTGEGGYPKYHLMEGCDLIFQMGTAKFGVRNEDGSLNDQKLAELAGHKEIKMIEIKFSQGAKPGKGGLLPKEKITDEIAELRGVPKGRDVISPSFHYECTDGPNTVAFIRRVQEVSQLPVGIKFCLGRATEFSQLVSEMKAQDVFPDYISIDGAEGGTGAAPKAFLDDFGTPLFVALPVVKEILENAGIKDRLKLFAAGKLIGPGRQMMAMSMGAQAIYSARGFLLSIGCIQALQCNMNTCPVGITTHDPRLTKGVDIEDKAHRVHNYVHNLEHDWYEMLAALGRRNFAELGEDNLLIPSVASNMKKARATMMIRR